MKQKTNRMEGRRIEKRECFYHKNPKQKLRTYDDRERSLYDDTLI